MSQRRTLPTVNRVERHRAATQTQRGSMGRFPCKGTKRYSSTSPYTNSIHRV